MADCAAAQRTSPAFPAPLARLSSESMSTPGSRLDGEIVPPGYVPIDPAAREVISSQLEPGENLLWAGRPNFLGVSIYAIAFVVTWMLALLIGTHKQVVSCSVVMLPLGAISLFVQTGIFMG